MLSQMMNLIKLEYIKHCDRESVVPQPDSSAYDLSNVILYPDLHLARRALRHTLSLSLYLEGFVR